MPFDSDPDKSAARNVLGSPLLSCSHDPVTGYFRDGCCNTTPQDIGLHTVCVRVTADFLRFSSERGNDLETPHLDFGFAGLKPGDQWCLCAARWQEAFVHGAAPHVVLAATHEATLNVVRLNDLKNFAIDIQ